MYVPYSASDTGTVGQRLLLRTGALEEDFADRERRHGPWADGVRQLLREEVDEAVARLRDDICNEISDEAFLFKVGLWWFGDILPCAEAVSPCAEATFVTTL